MENYESNISHTDISPYQSQKIIIQDLTIDGDFDIFESELKTFLSDYGNIIDFRILLNSNLKRPGTVLCIRHFR